MLNVTVTENAGAALASRRSEDRGKTTKPGEAGAGTDKTARAPKTPPGVPLTESAEQSCEGQATCQAQLSDEGAWANRSTHLHRCVDCTPASERREKNERRERVPAGAARSVRTRESQGHGGRIAPAGERDANVQCSSCLHCVRSIKEGRAQGRRAHAGGLCLALR